MAETPEQLDIEIDTTEVLKKEDEVKIEHVEEVSKKSDEPSPEEALETLRSNLKAEREARIEAERRAQESAVQAVRATNEVQDTNLHLISNAIESVKQNGEVLTANLRDAFAINDYDRVAKIQHEMSVNSNKLLQLENGKTQLENQPKQQIPTRQYTDPVESLASQLTPRSAEWVRKNPQYATNPKLYQKMLAAHQLVVSDDVEAESDEYFSRVESVLGMRSRDVTDNYQDPTMAAAKPTQKRSSPPAAPVTRSGNGTGSKSNVVRLTSEERDMASRMGMTDQEYAKNKLALQREGKLN